MSETTEVTPTPQLNGVRAALSKVKATVTDVLNAARPEKDLVALAETPIPRSAALNEEAEEAVSRVGKLLAELDLPDRRRMLTATELETLTRTYVEWDKASKGLTASREQIKAAIFNHFDAVAAHDGKIDLDTQHTKEGWAIVEDKTSAVVPGLDVKLTREVAGGKTELDIDRLRDLVEDEVITQEDFLALTRQIRVVDEARALEWLRKNPGRAHLLLEGTRTGSARASLYLRKND
jgi:hypothetical protein